VYQEQVMQISQIIGGYTLGGADMLRRAMGKKKADEMAKHRATIAEGAKKGLRPGAGRAAVRPDDQVRRVRLQQVAHRRLRGGHLPHRLAQGAPLRGLHGGDLSSDMDNTDTVKIFYDDAIANKLKVLGPDVNASEYRFTPVDRTTIRYGLGAVKGTGEQAVNVILKAREKGGPFKDLFDFCERVDKRMVNRRTIEALIRAGAFDALDDHRARLMASVGIAMEAAEQAERNAMQVSLFDVFDSGDTGRARAAIRRSAALDRAAEADRREDWRSVSSSPATRSTRSRPRSRASRQAAGLAGAAQGAALLAGLVVGVRTKITSRGKMAFVQLDDGTTSLEVSVFNEPSKPSATRSRKTRC
jgi:DNA polymerase-3 subunit alpha